MLKQMERHDDILCYYVDKNSMNYRLAVKGYNGCGPTTEIYYKKVRKQALELALLEWM